MALTIVQKVGIGWVVVIAAGLYSFVLSKRYVDSRRYENMKARERIKNSNKGDYDVSKYQQ